MNFLRASWYNFELCYEWLQQGTAMGCENWVWDVLLLFVAQRGSCTTRMVPVVSRTHLTVMRGSTRSLSLFFIIFYYFFFSIICIIEMIDVHHKSGVFSGFGSMGCAVFRLRFRKPLSHQPIWCKSETRRVYENCRIHSGSGIASIMRLDGFGKKRQDHLYSTSGGHLYPV